MFKHSATGESKGCCTTVTVFKSVYMCPCFGPQFPGPGQIRHCGYSERVRVLYPSTGYNYSYPLVCPPERTGTGVPVPVLVQDARPVYRIRLRTGAWPSTRGTGTPLNGRGKAYIPCDVHTVRVEHMPVRWTACQDRVMFVIS